METKALNVVIDYHFRLLQPTISFHKYDLGKTISNFTVHDLSLKIL